ncbi:tRNA lysidine(34) synthetase TilS [Lacticaseibacillus manihotivorans]|jgi:tRNA(Ile)-lysidine synthase|uniref:tRNA(Ile)-lysidine synthase n=2 Tax=Lacticaseibacillus manihotivorans TaxID=88233 RepID=A0A0R1QAB2_9LACO|nr:tRNA lysidine(34) synthetase TilS [Lacticaseibacillus manihotivorans]KRL41230.1 tRNA(Ile)-lysidine synthetase, MesJ [Lacticaseibacillus manihotivorans DSM 13343 = JCM 12514]QFQ90346.1 tRNA lysidine(34) synthetase TilS [Lacticaseibacillus manihotivorans]
MLSGNDLLHDFALDPKAPLIVAVSGGVDSMVLLNLLSQTTHPLIAATFDHQMRATSGDDVQLVEDYAKQLGVTVVAGEWLRKADQTVSEATARTARYQFLADTAHRYHSQYLVLAHHGDDQLEGILLQLARSGNVMAMSGMQPSRPLGDLQVLRPLLHFSKADLHAYAEKHHVPYSVDQTNADDTIARNRVRHLVTPVLKDLNAGVLLHTQRFSESLEALIQLATPGLQALVPKPEMRTDWTSLLKQTAGVQRLVLEQYLQAFHIQIPAQVITQVLQALAQAKGNKHFDVAKHHLDAAYGKLYVDAPRAIRQPELPLSVDDTWHELADGRMIGLFHERPQCDTWAYVPAKPVVIRQKVAGDYVALPNGHHKKLQPWLIGQKVPQFRRDDLLVADQDFQLVWVEIPTHPELFQTRQTDIIQAVLALKKPANDSEDNNGK